MFPFSCFRSSPHGLRPAILAISCWLLSPLLAPAQSLDIIRANDVTWPGLGTNENNSMPLGNGDLAANVWTEPNGDLVLLVAKSDAWTEMGKLVKLGRVRIHLSPNPFVGAADVTQTLKLEDGSLEIKSGDNLLTVWADANRPVLHVEAKLPSAASWSASLELWRTDQPDNSGMFELSGPLHVQGAADTVFPAHPDQIAWCHFNPDSIYPLVLNEEHLSAVVRKYPDPLLHRCFGAALSGPGLESNDDHTLISRAPGRNLRLDLVALTATSVDSPQVWRHQLDALVQQVSAVKLKKAWSQHQQWWADFWSRSWLHVAGTPDAEKVSQGYLMQRYMLASSSRGAFPVKFNGGLFTVGHNLSPGQRADDHHHSPDYRAWGNSYWNQNNRLLYWPLLATGDFDLLKPWFGMYLAALPLAEDRTQIYFHHAGASLPETMLFWGLPNLNDFGWNNPTTQLQSPWQRYHIQGTLEIIAQMLDQYDITQDAGFARTNLIPFATAIVTYYDQHWPRGADGKINISPAQSLETYQLDAVNPTPDLAGLNAILPRLLALPPELVSAEQRQAWNRTLADLPPIPTGKTVHGRLGDYGQGDPDGKSIILPAEKYGSTKNGENPELYVAFPYRLYGVGKPGLTLAQDTFAARRFPQDVCWGQDGPQSAVLGLTSVAKKAVIDEFTDYGDQQFPWFWKAGHDWIPDYDNGGTGMITLQLMLLQCDGRRIQLLPAWPDDWTADFKLHAPYQTTISGHVEHGKITHLTVLPATRAKDVVLAHP